MRKLVLGLTVVSAMMLVAAAPANATRAIVFKNGDVACTTDPGDVPGFGVIQLPKATSVVRGDGVGNSTVTAGCQAERRSSGRSTDRFHAGCPV